jgi:plastocyanin
MNIFDSRIISPMDRFAQCFPLRAQYRYGFLPLALGRGNPANSPFTINVKETRDPKRESRQHNVIVRTDCGHLKAEPAELEIAVNDLVSWSACDTSTPVFSISGYSETHSFSSEAMSTGAIYAHAFGSEGLFEWGDANGQPLSGRVKVIMPPMGTPREIEAYRERLARAVVIVIREGKARPSEVEIVVNGVVYFVVEQGDGFTVTDRRLIAGTTVPGQPDPAGKC